MRVVVVLPGIARRPTGGFDVVYRYADALVARGHEVLILHTRTTSASDGRASAALRALSYLLRRRHRPRWYPLDRRVRVRSVGRPSIRMLPRDADVLIATGVRTAGHVAAACRASGARGLYLVQHVETFVVPAADVEASWALPLEKVVVSGWLRDVLAEAGQAGVLVPNGIDRAVFRPAGTGEPVVPTVLAMVSEQPWKRTDLVCTAFATIARERPEVRLVTFGTGPRPAGLPAAVRHVRDPARGDLVALYQGASVYLCASDDEGFGLPVAEAMACGAAVVCTDIAGVRSFAGTAPVYAEVGQGDQLARALLELLGAPDALREARARSRATAEGLDAARSAERFVRLVESGCDGARP